MGAKFDLTLPSLHYLIADILGCKEQPKLVKVDIARAFRNLRINPGDTVKLDINHNFIYLFGVLHRFQHCKVISQQVVGRAEETSTYSWSRFCTVN